MLACLAALSLLCATDGRVEGWVVRGNEGVPGARLVLAEVSHARITYRGPEDIVVGAPGASDAQRWMRDVRADARGAFRVEGLAPGEWAVLGSHTGEIAQGLALANFQLADGGNANLRVVLRSPAFFELQIRPEVAGTELRLATRYPHLNLFLEPSFAARSAEELSLGQWRSLALPPVFEWDLWVDRVAADGSRWLFARDILEATPGEATREAFDFSGGPHLSGRVLDAEGKPAAGVYVWGRSGSVPPRERGALTDAEGRFQLANVRTGTWKLVARAKPAHAPSDACQVAAPLALARQLALVPPEGTEGLELRLAAVEPLCEGELVPEPEVSGFSSKPPTLAGLRGRPLALVFWDARCEDSLALLPRLEALRRESGEAFGVLAIELSGDIALVRKLTAGLPWQHAFDAERGYGTLQRRLGVDTLPHLALVASDGTLSKPATDLAGLAAR
jgi:hypothetical protein